MSKKVCIYDTSEVLEKELEAIIEKYPNLMGDDLEKEMNDYLKKEADILRSEPHDYDTFDKRIEYTIEEENGEIWICMKLFNIKRLQEKFGTEPD